MNNEQQIPQGYKSSELGTIPQDWDVKRLRDAIEQLETGVSVNSSDDINSNAKILKTSSVLRGEFIPSECKYIIEIDVCRAKCNPRANSLIISRMNTPELVGECGYVRTNFDDLFLPDRLWQTVFKLESCIDPKYINYLLNTKTYRTKIKELATGTSNSMKNITKSDWLNIAVAVPPLEEQERIAEILGTWDRAIELQGRKVALLQSRKRALMQQLLTPHRRRPNFSEPWKTTKLGEIGNTYNGLTGKTKEDFGFGLPYISYMTVFNSSKIKGKIMDYVNIGENETQNMVKYGDAFFTVSSETPEEVGMSSVLLDNINNTYLNSFCFGYRLFNFETLLPEFAQFYFRSKKFRIEMYMLAQGSTRFNISKSEVLKLKIKLPPIEEQRAIAEVLTTADREIELATQNLTALSSQKRALMQQLLTGKKQVTI